MQQTWRIEYKILPAGVGPDDYESADLADGEGVFTFPEPDPVADPYGHRSGGDGHGPLMVYVKEAVEETLTNGDRAIVLDMQRQHTAD